MSEKITITHNEDHSSTMEDEFIVLLKSVDDTVKINLARSRPFTDKKNLIRPKLAGSSCERDFEDTALPRILTRSKLVISHAFQGECPLHIGDQA
jgi:hypothetical protein